MKLIVGLGNPGEKYESTRHNVGFVVLDKLAQELGIMNYELSKKFQSFVSIYSQFTSDNSSSQSLRAGGPQLILAKPQTFMNQSGKTVKFLATYYKLHATDIWVIHDDLDIKLGQYKIQFGKGPKEHGGLLSIYKEIGTKNFWHVRIGVENRGDLNRVSGESYVLQKFEENEIIPLKSITHELKNQLIKE